MPNSKNITIGEIGHEMVIEIKHKESEEIEEVLKTAALLFVWMIKVIQETIE